MRQIMRKLILLNILIFSTIVSAQTTLRLDGKNITLDPTSTVTIDPLTGNITATSANGNLTCAEVGDPPTLTLTANPTMIDSGDSVTLSWTVGSNADTCTKSGDWSGSLTGSLVTNGLHSEVVSNVTANSNYTLQCTNNFGSSPSRTASVTLIGGNPNCINQPPILGGNADSTIRLIPGAFPGQIGSPQNPASYNGTYDEIAPGSGGPGVYGTQSFFNLTANNYIAMEFTTDNLNSIAKLVFTPPGNGQGAPSTAVTIAISECPGDFTTHLGQERCLRVGAGTPNIRWSQNPATNGATHCLLEKDKTYFYNIVHSNSTANGYTTTGCTSSSCGGIFSHTNEAN
jgi:hypothetical protein